MATHGERIEEGFGVLVALGVIASVILGAKLVWDHMIGPHLKLIGTGVGAIVALFVVAYIAGYIVTDLPEDIREWSK